MASAWGNSWGKAWGNAWGTIATITATTSGGGPVPSRHRIPPRVQALLDLKKERDITMFRAAIALMMDDI